MPEEALTPAEVAVLYALMAEAREVSNVDLKKRYGFTLTGRERTRLNDFKLVSSRRQGQAFAHVLEEKGWGRCRTELTASPPPNAGTVAGGFYALLHGLHRYIQVADISLADMFRQQPAPPPVDPIVGVEAEVRTAYHGLSTGNGARVALAVIRQALAHVPRPTLDTALRRMITDPNARLEAQENQQRLTPEDRQSKVRVGRRHYHFLIIEQA